MSTGAARIFYSAKADADDRFGSKHPTVKPVDLIAWLIRLVTPKGGLVMDPFAGSGTCGMAALREGARAILIEREAEYYADILARLEWARGEGKHSAAAKMRHRVTDTAALPLFSTPKDAAE
jgi:DNA modification methylase